MIRKGFSSLGTVLLYLISLLPFFVLYLIADFIYLVLFYVIKYRRAVVQQNLANAFPEKPLHERQQIEKKYYRYLADLMVETVKLRTISRRQVDRRFTVTNYEAVEKAFAGGQSVIGAVGHYGNWELGALKFSILTDKPRLVVYKPLNNLIFNSYFTRMRSRFGASLVPMKGAMRKMVELRRQQTMTLLVSDQIPSREEVTYFTNFLNQPTAVFLGVEKLAKSLNSAVIFCDIRRIKRGYYNCNFVPLFYDAKHTAEYEITNAHVRYLEQVIREEPQYWLWSHKRWKYKPEDIAK
ncbi:lysophospholipid acyltransferase family protein [Mucilaginibacter sp. CSA2-8R]|uniref:lysophospholipid acyltransferase family protein n=1 Tax=Mucilaginibacter sp. CSA2-8R TaxID=3141542 RepID=UPI00315CBE84